VASAALGIFGFASGVLGVGYLESRRRRLVHTQDVSQLMKLRVFGNIPFAPGLETRPLTEVWNTRSDIVSSHLIEAINDVRTVLLAGGKGRNHQVVILTSADQNEGKTTLACLLALSIAQIGKRTLLIDADLRNPRVADRLGLQPAAGFGELLRGEASPDGAIGMVPETPLAVITAGRACTNLIRGLSVERVNKVFAALREQFDYIIVDSSPTTISDGLVIGACADAALLVIRSGQTEEPSAREACQRMIASHVPLMGGILNGVPLSRRLRYPYLTLPPVANVSEETDDLPMAQETDETPDELPISG
jgi:capsular exopolysaccharide synthesis family protein